VHEHPPADGQVRSVVRLHGAHGVIDEGVGHAAVHPATVAVTQSHELPSQPQTSGAPHTGGRSAEGQTGVVQEDPWLGLHA
jgi:hypothetical protein